MTYSEAEGVPCTLFDEANDVTFPAGQAFNTCDLTGTEPDGNPKLSASLSSEYTARDWLSNSDVYIRVQYNYRDTRPTVVNTTINDLPSFGTVNLYTGFRSKDEKWDLMLWVDNLTNKQALTAIGGNDSYTNSYVSVNFISERSAGLTASYNF